MGLCLKCDNSLLHFPFDPGSAARLVINKCATGSGGGDNAICLSNVEGKLWVSESGQKLYMEFGRKMLNIKPAKDIFAVVPCPNRAVTTPQSTQGI